MLDLSRPVAFDDLGILPPADVIQKVLTFCKSGGSMHPDALRTVVLKLAYISRDLQITQSERDEAAGVATSLANAAVKSYGKTSDFCTELVASIRAVMSSPVAA